MCGWLVSTTYLLVGHQAHIDDDDGGDGGGDEVWKKLFFSPEFSFFVLLLLVLPLPVRVVCCSFISVIGFGNHSLCQTQNDPNGCHL